MAEHRSEILLWLIGASVALAVSVFMEDPYLRSVLNLMAISTLLAASLRFVLLMGELNFALPAFTGIGAYAAGYLNTALSVPFGLAVLAAGLLTALISAGFGAIALRAKGPYFLLIGFAFTEAIRVLYSKIPALGGTSGMVGIFPDRSVDPWMSMIIMAVVVVLLLAFYIAERSDFGRILAAIHENENIARSVGINTYLCKIIAISAACFAAGIGGGLHGFANSVISPGDFSYLLAAFALAYVKVGGEDHFLGPIVGAIALVALSNYAIGFGGDEHFIYGGAIILAVLMMPRGVIGAATGLRHRISTKLRVEAGQNAE